MPSTWRHGIIVSSRRVFSTPTEERNTPPETIEINSPISALCHRWAVPGCVGIMRWLNRSSRHSRTSLSTGLCFPHGTREAGYCRIHRSLLQSTASPLWTSLQNPRRDLPSPPGHPARSVETPLNDCPENLGQARISEADQRAGMALAQRIPVRLTSPPRHQPPPQPAGIYHQIADDLHNAITNGTYPTGNPLPTVHELTTRYHVSASTIHRAFAQLAEQNLIAVSRGRRAIVLPHKPPFPHRAFASTPSRTAIPFPVPAPQPRSRPIRRSRIARTAPRPHVAGIPHATHNSTTNRRHECASPQSNSLPAIQYITFVYTQAPGTTHEKMTRKTSEQQVVAVTRRSLIVITVNDSS
jgi:DNA-binding transcriptional regulator YhcF (GntR family)